MQWSVWLHSGTYVQVLAELARILVILGNMSCWEEVVLSREAIDTEVGRMPGFLTLSIDESDQT